MPSEEHDRRSRIALVAATAGLATASLLYRALGAGGLEQTAALFIGIPALLAVALSLAPHPRSPLGVAMKATTLALLLSGVLLGEGFVCILMAAPLFYAVVLSVVALVGLVRRRGGGGVACTLVFLPLLPMSLEGVAPMLSFEREERVRVERVVDVSSRRFERALAGTPRFDAPLPLYLRLGFPRPVRAEGEGLAPGSPRRFDFAGGEGRPGSLHAVVASRGENRVRFAFGADTSHVAHWLRWRHAEVRWEPEGDAQTRVVWEIAYRRDLDPAWYFRPWQRYAVGLAAGYLIDCYAAHDG